MATDNTTTPLVDLTQDEARQCQAFLDVAFHPDKSITDLPRIDREALHKLCLLVYKVVGPKEQARVDQ